MSTEYDLVLANGRVMDPETNLDAVRNVGILDGTVTAITKSPLQGKEVIDVKGLVVAPGFIDINQHGFNKESDKYQVTDGVTTSLDIENGRLLIDDWYKIHEGNSMVNFGITVGQIAARIAVMGPYTFEAPAELDEIFDLMGKFPNTEHDASTSEQVEQIVAHLQEGLDAGALGIGIGLGYTPGVTPFEMQAMFQVAAKNNVPIVVHIRELYADIMNAIEEVIGYASVAGVSIHVNHITSYNQARAPELLNRIKRAQGEGVSITTELYPYDAYSTYIQSSLFDGDWQKATGITYGDLEWVATGERLTPETFEKYRKIGGAVVAFAIPSEQVSLCIADPDVIVSSDGLEYHRGVKTDHPHPRGAGTFSRVLGMYVRERQLIELMTALRKMTLLPAQRVETVDPQMKKKGRVQVGSDADITVFDPNTIIDQATYQNPLVYSKGIAHVLVNGTFVVKNSQLLENVFPGKPIRRSH